MNTQDKLSAVLIEIDKFAYNQGTDKSCVNYLILGHAVLRGFCKTMTFKVVGSDLRYLVSKLEKQLPHSIRVYGLAISCSQGYLKDVEVWTDQWPHFKSVFTRLHPSIPNTKVRRDHALFTSEDTAEGCEKFFKELVIWNQPSLFGGVSGFVSDCIRTAGEAMQQSVLCMETCILMEHKTQVADTDDLTRPHSPEFRIPDGFKARPLTRADIYLIISRWKFAYPGAENGILVTLSSFPNIGIEETMSGQLVAWVMVGWDWIIEKLHVLPEYRRRGLARAALASLISQIINLKIVPRVIIEKDNNASIDLFKRLNFVTVLEEDLHWVRSQAYSAKEID